MCTENNKPIHSCILNSCVDTELMETMNFFHTLPENGGKFIKHVKHILLTNKKSFSPDIRVSRWPLMENVYPTVMISIVYVLTIVFGRKWMKNQKPFELRNFMFVYNIIQVVVCAYVTYEV